MTTKEAKDRTWAGQGCNSAVESLLNIHEDLGQDPSLDTGPLNMSIFTHLREEKEF